jgi:hypothetical protein
VLPWCARSAGAREGTGGAALEGGCRSGGGEGVGVAAWEADRRRKKEGKIKERKKRKEKGEKVRKEKKRRNWKRKRNRKMGKEIGKSFRKNRRFSWEN